MSSNAILIGGVVSGFCVIAGYSIYLWRVFKSNPGNRLIECGVLTVIAFLAMVPFSGIPSFTDHIPDWIFMLWLFLVVLLCFTTLFFLAQRIWRALAHGQKH